MIKKIVFAFIIILLLIVSNLLGGYLGFQKGTEAALYIRDLGDIPMTVIMLKELHRGKTDRTIRVMESKLDQQIYTMDTCKSAYDSIYNIDRFDSSFNLTRKDAEKGFMKRAVEYRREIPSSTTVPEFTKMVNDILKKYENDKK